MNVKTAFVLFSILLVAFVIACSTKSDELEDPSFGSGIYVVNEGLFTGNNGSVSYYDPGTGNLLQHIFQEANGRPLGDVVQSFSVNADTTGFIVVNGSAKVEVVDMRTFKAISEPLIASYPRYFLPVTAAKGYLTNGSMDGYVLVIDLNNYVITDSIHVGFGPESMLLVDTKVYVCNSGGWVSDSTITIINSLNDLPEDTIQVGKVPVDIVADADLNIWVYCKGYASYDWDPPYDLINETNACLQKIDPLTHEIIWQENVGMAGDYTAVPSRFAISQDGLYVYYLRPDGVYKLSVRNPQIAQNPVIAGSYYGIEIHPAQGDIYLFEAPLSGHGTMKIYDAEMNLTATLEAGIMPNGAVIVP